MRWTLWGVELCNGLKKIPTRNYFFTKDTTFIENNIFIGNDIFRKNAAESKKNTYRSHYFAFISRSFGMLL